MDNKRENEMETGVIRGPYGDPKIQTMALKPLNITCIGLFGFLANYYKGLNNYRSPFAHYISTYFYKKA